MQPAAKQTTIIPGEVSESDALPGIDPEDGPEAEGFLLPNEADQLRNEKLAAIRKAIANGSYDAPEVMDKALEKLLERLEADAEPPAG
jgi:Anti-sigma-28 factor, FlgM